MKKIILAVTLLVTGTTAVQAEDFWHDSVRGCIVGGGVVGATSALVLYPAVMSGATTVPATAIVIGNSIFGCGLGTIGTMLIYGAHSLYMNVFGEASKGEEASQNAH
jgi:hypothetical protein